MSGIGRVGLAISRHELAGHPSEHVVDDGAGLTDVGVAGEATGLEALVGELLDQSLERHAVLKRHAGEGTDGVHESADGGTFLGHGDKQFARLAVVEETHRQVALVSGDVELVVHGHAGIGQAAADRVLGAFAQCTQFGLQLGDAAFERLDLLGRSGCVGLVAALVGALGVERLRALGSIAVDGHALQAHLPGVHVGAADVGRGGVVRHVHRLGDGSGDERLGGTHHAQVRLVVDAPLALERLEGAVEDRQVLRLEARGDDGAVFADHVFDGVVDFDVLLDGGDGAGRVTEALQGLGHGAVDDLEHAAAGQEFVLHQGDVGFHAGGVTVHEEGDGAGGGEHSDLSVAVAHFAAPCDGAVPGAAGFVLEVGELAAGLDAFDGVAVLLHHAQGAGHVVLGHRLGNASAGGVLVAGEGALDGRHLGALLVGMPGHDGREGTGQSTPLVGVVGQAITHDERTEVRVAQSQRAEHVGILGDHLGRIAGVVHQDLLGRDVDADRRLEALDVELPVRLLELHEVQRGEVAGRVVEEHVLGAGVGRMDRLGALASMPFLDGTVVLQTRIAANPGALGDLVEHSRGVLLLEGLTGHGGECPPLLAVDGRLHEGVRNTHREVLVLIHHRTVSLTVERAIVALLDEGPGLLLFLGLGGDELLHVAVGVADGVHLGGATGLAAGLHHVGHLVIDLEEAHRTRRTAAAGELLAAGTNRGQVSAGARAVLEEHGLRVGQFHDALHVVLDRLDEAGAGLRILVLGGGAAGHLGLAVPEPIAPVAALADLVLVVQPHIEPNRRIEGPILVDAQPGQLVVEHLAVFLAEVPVGHTPVRDGPGHPMDELLDRFLPLRLGRISVEVLGADHLGGQNRPVLRNFDPLLLEDGLARIIGDLRRAAIPFDLVEGLDLRVAEDPLEWQLAGGRGRLGGRASSLGLSVSLDSGLVLCRPAGGSRGR